MLTAYLCMHSASYTNTLLQRKYSMNFIFQYCLFNSPSSSFITLSLTFVSFLILLSPFIHSSDGNFICTHYNKFSTYTSYYLYELEIIFCVQFKQQFLTLRSRKKERALEFIKMPCSEFVFSTHNVMHD